MVRGIECRATCIFCRYVVCFNGARDGSRDREQLASDPDSDVRAASMGPAMVRGIETLVRARSA